MSDSPIRFCFGLHLHQPVGNFGHVFEQHVRDVYRPFLEHVRREEFFPLTLHVSGPLIDWFVEHEPAMVEMIADLAGDGRLELLLAGYYEPILASLPSADRLSQIQWMREALREHFGVDATGLWLTERVWEPDLARDLHDAGVRYALVDDRHFLVSGFGRDRLHVPFHTEHDGRSLTLFPIDERLRYLVPFQSPDETVGYLNWLRAQGRSLAVLADDGEKFGGWPGTREWVYEQGWIDRFFRAMKAAMDRGEVILSRFDEALRTVPSGGLAYLPTASYREMEGWSLPAPAALRLSALEHELGHARMQEMDGALVRGSHWRNFLVKYAESNRMHKKMLVLSSMCRERGDPPAARRAIGKAQCNDAYWHGVFGGLYLPFLRAEIWRNLAAAEAVLREGEGLHWTIMDRDWDGLDEIWVHSGRCSALVSPARGGAVEELTWFGTGHNLADTLTRRREAYHEQAYREAQSEVEPPAPADGEAPATTPSIHELEAALRLKRLPPVDLDDRAIFIERVLPGDVTAVQYEASTFAPLASFSHSVLEAGVAQVGETVVVKLESEGGSYGKVLTFFPDGEVRAMFSWEGSEYPEDAWFTTEVSLSRAQSLVSTPEAEVWEHPIETVAKSERGLDHTVQGVSYLLRWPVRSNKASVVLKGENG